MNYILGYISFYRMDRPMKHKEAAFLVILIAIGGSWASWAVAVHLDQLLRP